MKQKKQCGRIDKHLSHYWMSARVWEGWFMGGPRFIRPTFWCSGQVVTEGGHHDVHR